ncbi:MAG: HAD-IA family hydrolase [bacterium]
MTKGAFGDSPFKHTLNKISPLNNMIKAIFFDMGNVLLKDGYTSGIKKYEEINSIESGRLYEAMHNRPYWKKFTLGLISEKKYFSSVEDNFKGALDIGDLRQIILANFIPNHEIANYIKTLKNYLITGIISNNPKEWFECAMEKNGWDDIFKIKVVSGYVHIRKPDKEIFRYALEQTGITGQETIYVDDRDDRIQGALDNQFNIIIYKDLEQLKKEIRKYI